MKLIYFFSYFLFFQEMTIIILKFVETLLIANLCIEFVRNLIIFNSMINQRNLHSYFYQIIAAYFYKYSHY